MKVITNEYVTFWDVDDTLVMHGLEGGLRVKIKDPISDKYINLMVNEPMVRLMQEEAGRGAYIVVWSRGGQAWANAVVTALNLDPHVHLIMSKPMAYFDDKPIEEWLPYRVYLGPDMPYKNYKPKNKLTKEK